MLRPGPCILVCCGLILSPAAAVAQDAPQASITAVQYFKCQDTETFDRVVETAWLPYVRQALADGRLLSWGQLNHFWGDEWNRVLYNTAPDIQTFHAAFADIAQASLAEHPELFAEIARACSEHRDNIYMVARALPAMTAGGDAGDDARRARTSPDG